MVGLTDELVDVKEISIDYKELTASKFNEDTFGGRLRKSRIESGLAIGDVTDVCGVTNSVVSGYELDRYFPSKEVFDIEYLCRDDYTELLWNFERFLYNLKKWKDDNGYKRKDVASKLGVSPALINYWYNGGVIKASLYDKIRTNIERYNLI